MDNQVFSVSKEVDNETPILSPLITPSTPRSTCSFGPLQLDLNTDNISPNISCDSNEKSLNIKGKMSGELFLNKETQSEADRQLSPVHSNDVSTHGGLNKKSNAVRPKQLRLQIPQTPASPEPTPTQDRNANELVMSRRFDFGSSNSGENKQTSGQMNGGKQRHVMQTQESIHDPRVSLLHGQTDSTVCSCNTQCVKCGKTLQEEDINRHIHQKHQQKDHCVNIPDHCDRNLTSVNSNNPPEELTMNKSQSKSILITGQDDHTDNYRNQQQCDTIVKYSKSKSCCHCFRTVFMLILLVLLSFAISFIVYKFVFVNNTPGLIGIGGNGSVCVPCDSLILTSDPSDDHTKSLTRRGDQCCAGSPQEIEQIIEAIAEKKVRMNEIKTPLRRVQYQPYSNKTKNMYAAHVYLGPLPNPQRTTTTSMPEYEYEEEYDYDIAHEYQILKGWTKSPPTAFVRKGIDFLKDKGRFRVNREGIYKVYSHLSVNKPKGASDVGVVFSQRIFRENIRFPQPAPKEVLEDTQVAPCPNIPTNHACHSSTLDSLLSLRNGDEIFVSVTHPELISTDKISSFFGIYRVD